MQSTIKIVKSGNSIKEIPVAHEGWPVVWTPFCFASLRMLNNNRCGFNQLELSGLSGLLQSVHSLQVSVAMLYYSIVMVSIG